MNALTILHTCQHAKPGDTGFQVDALGQPAHIAAVTVTLIDRCARAAYEASMTLRSDPDQPYQPWETLPDRWQRIYRVQAEAVRGVLLAESDEPVVADPDQPDLWEES